MRFVPFEQMTCLVDDVDTRLTEGTNDKGRDYEDEPTTVHKVNADEAQRVG